MEVVLEVLGTTNNVLERQRINADRITIGRGYDNDIILSDEHVDVAHAELSVNEAGQVIMRDLGSVNGTRLKKRKRRLDASPVESGDVFVIGRNRLRVLFADHQLPPAVRIRALESFLIWLGRSSVIATLAVVYVLSTFGTAYNRAFGDFDWSSFLSGQALGIASFIGLVTFVYLISVLFRRSGNFLAHLSVVLFVAVLASVTQFILAAARFNAGDNFYELIDWLDSASSLLMTFLYLWSVLYLAFNLSMRLRTMISAAAVVAIGLFSMTTTDTLERFNFRQRFPEQTVFLSPKFLFASPLTAAQYEVSVGELFSDIDLAREERLMERDKHTEEPETEIATADAELVR